MFPLSRAERDEVVVNCDHLLRLKFSPTMPFAFTEHGALMAASVNTRRAVGKKRELANFGVVVGQFMTYR